MFSDCSFLVMIVVIDFKICVILIIYAMYIPQLLCKLFNI